MADITMSLDETLEVDAVVEEWNSPSDVITDSDDQFDVSGIQTNTGVLNPKNAGEHKITVNGQELTVKVTDPTTIPDSGVARLEFEQDVTDSWGSNDGTDQTSAGYTTDAAIGSYAKSFDGTDDYVDVGGINIDYTQDWTVSAWINTSAQTDQAIFTLDANQRIRINEDPNNSGSWTVNVFDGSTALVGATDVTGDVWRMMTFAHNSGGSSTMYIDDSSDGSGSFSFSNTNTENIGRRQDDIWYFDGDIDDVRIYNKELSSTEVSNLYSLGSIGG